MITNSSLHNRDRVRIGLIISSLTSSPLLEEAVQTVKDIG